MEPRVLIIAENASLQFGGEAALPLHYYRILRRRHIPVWLVVHARTRAELLALFPEDQGRIAFIPDTTLHRLIWRFSEYLPTRLATFTAGFVMRLLTQIAQRKVVRRLIQQERITVIHQPTPVSPKEPSIIYGMGVPVIMGPMNGGINYPPAFSQLQSKADRWALAVGRGMSRVVNLLMPGKRHAAMLIVANDRTRAALPIGACRRVETMVENGVDLSLWDATRPPPAPFASPTQLVYVGRLVDWKAVDLLLEAFAKASRRVSISLSIIGDGAERSALEDLARRSGLLGDEPRQAGKVFFHGWKSQTDCALELRHCDGLVLSSLAECGGAVVLEAMAMQIPVIATDWGGPADYLDPKCGILVAPTSREAFVSGFADAMSWLAEHPAERTLMGKDGRSKVVEAFDWEKKVDRMIDLYQEVMDDYPPPT